jgi:UV DNA damage endonuclease
MDLMIEAKDNEQAVFELMRKFKLPSFNHFNDFLARVRNDENKHVKPPRQTANRKSDIENEPAQVELIPDEEAGMSRTDRSVHWPLGMDTGKGQRGLSRTWKMPAVIE